MAGWHTYERQPLKVALLVGLLAIVAITGSYMLYNRQDNTKHVAAQTPTVAGWQVYTSHDGRLRFDYPARWSISEAPTSSLVTSTAIYVYSPENTTTVSIVDDLSRTNTYVTGTILASEPAHLFGKRYFWDYIQAQTPANTQTGGGPVRTVTADLLTTAGTDATVPLLPDSTNNLGVSVTIHNFSATDSANQLQGLPDVATAKRIAESLRIATKTQ